jgi:CHAT domain-containing protein
MTGARQGLTRGEGLGAPLGKAGGPFEFLVLTGVNTWMQGGVLPAEAEDGMLTAEDVSGMNLLATELVVLSACDTGRGEVQTGEGVMGLRRAFVLAGAQTLVMSLWSVPDIATAILMEQFYRNLLQGRGRAEALHRAQDALRRMTVSELRKDWLSPAMIIRLAAGDPDVEFDLEELAAQPDDHRPFSKPRYWGGFICQGVPGPLRSTSMPQHTMPQPVRTASSPTPVSPGTFRR